MLKVQEKLMLVVLLLIAAQASPAYAGKDASMGSTESFAGLKEGDILMASNSHQRGIGVSMKGRIWEDGVVPYYLDPTLGRDVVASIESAIDMWNTLAGISLVKINPADPNSPNDYLHFVKADGCASWVGRQGGAQSVWAAQSCSAGSMMHEIGHALGLEHEHTRPDRDQHIQINWNNIVEEKLANFDVSDSDKQYYGPYDPASIMHYGEYFFSKNGAPTIQSLYDNSVSLGQRNAPSSGDVAAIAEIYGTDLELATQLDYGVNQTSINLMVTNQTEQGANELEIELQVGTAEVKANNSKQWDCATQSGIMRCKLSRLPGSARSDFAFSLDEALSEEFLSIRLYSKTHDNNIANNFSALSPAAAQAVGSGSGGNQLYSDGVATASTSGASLSHWLMSLLLISLWGRVVARRRVS